MGERRGKCGREEREVWGEERVIVSSIVIIVVSINPLPDQWSVVIASIHFNIVSIHFNIIDVIVVIVGVIVIIIIATHSLLGNCQHPFPHRQHPFQHH